MASVPPELVERAPSVLEAAPERGASRPRVPTRPAQRWAGALLPGAGQLLRREWGRGLALLCSWLGLLAVPVARGERMLAVLRASRPSVDELVAVVAWVAMAVAVWALAWADLRRAGRAVAPRGESQWSIALRQFRRNRMAIAGLAFLLVVGALALLAPLVAPYDPAAQGDIVVSRYLPPSAAHWMGTDKFGRDILSRVLYGARISLSIGFLAVTIGVALGAVVGAVAGYFRGWVDGVLMRFTDLMLAIPRLVLLIVVIALFEPSLSLVVLVLGLTGWMPIARIVRAEILSLREREFIQAARALGMSDGRIIARHLLPNTLAPIIVYATLGIGNTILTEAALSFLGLGVQPPTPSWGNMISDGRDALLTGWWIATFPGLAIVFTTIAFNLVGDGLRDALDPRLGT